ncbi:MAG: HEAT repeat domain-containing protein, partial [Candidatus Aminicenantes bacterium]|nr:HEAT repeat domain-containing protein [Candidatus Aminicenantes bacterium]
AEFQEFLDVIRKESFLPAEESDVVNAMWEKDFANIRYYAPDDFLETKIGLKTQIKKYEVDKKKISVGAINLKPNERKSLEKGKFLGSQVSGINDDSWKKMDFSEQFSPLLGSMELNEQEKGSIEFMLTNNRKITKDDELLSLLFEMLYLEKNDEIFADTLKILMESFEEFTEKDNFKKTVAVIRYIHELKKDIHPHSQVKTQNLNKFLQNLANPDMLNLLSQKIREKKIPDMENCLIHLRLIGPKSLPILAYVVEHYDSKEIKIRALRFFRELGKHDLPTVSSIARNDSPVITNEIIFILSECPESTALKYLNLFNGYINKSIKINAIHAIGRFKSEAAARTLSNFFDDEDEGIRILAAQNIQVYSDETLFNKLEKLVSDKKFHKSSREEKLTFLETLGKSKSLSALDALQDLIKKVGFFSRPKKVESGLCAVSGLQAMGTDDALESLKRAVKSKKKTIRTASRNAIAKLEKNRNKNSQSEEKIDQS